MSRLARSRSPQRFSAGSPGDHSFGWRRCLVIARTSSKSRRAVRVRRSSIAPATNKPLERPGGDHVASRLGRPRRLRTFLALPRSQILPLKLPLLAEASSLRLDPQIRDLIRGSVNGFVESILHPNSVGGEQVRENTVGFSPGGRQLNQVVLNV